MKSILIILLFMVTINYAQVTQEWAAIYGSPINYTDFPKGIVADNQGNVFVACSLYAPGVPPKGAIIKYNSAGQEEWVIPFGGEEVAFISDIAIDSSGNIYVTGGTGPNPNTVQLTTIKYNTSGASLWVNKYNRVAEGEDVGLAITLDQTANVFVTGYCLTTSIGSRYITIKYNQAGAREWVKIYDNAARAIDIGVDSYSNAYVTGLSHGLGKSNNYVTLKYSPSGLLLWAQSYDGPGSFDDTPSAIAVDLSDNVVVTGSSSSDYATIKYNSSGDSLWIKRYDGGYGFDRAWGIVVDNERSVYVTGLSQMATKSVIVTIKYDSLGNQLWLNNENGSANAIAIDNDKNIYIVGGVKTDYQTIKYNSNGNQVWIQTYSRTTISGESAFEIAVDLNQNVYVSGYNQLPGISNYDVATVKYKQSFKITRPSGGEKWIAGETDTIRWAGGQAGKFVSVEYSTDDGQTYIQITSDTPADSNYYVWNIPKGILTTEAKIKITDVIYPEDSAVSEVFKIKGYNLTTLFPNGKYDPYSRNFDAWNFGNNPNALWNPNYYSQFNYQGIDPFTNLEYPQYFGGSVFRKANSSDFPDWISFVNAFGVNVCYKDISFGTYSPTAIAFWESIKNVWNGSCYGMAISNFLYFSNKTAFINKCVDLPDQPSAGLLNPNNYLVSIINELWIHQFGNPHRQQRQQAALKSPNETLNEIRDMLLDEDYEHRILVFINNNIGGGGHAVNPYRVERDTINPDRYFVYVYDNSYFNNLSSRFIINITGDNGNGSWTNLDWPTWGGNFWFWLEEPVTTFLDNPALPKKGKNKNNFFATSNGYIDIWNNPSASIIISDHLGNLIGYSDSLLITQMPDAIPFIPATGSETPPYGYIVPEGNYHIQMQEFSDSISRISMFTDNSVFSIKRTDSKYEHKDNIYFNDGLSFSNPDDDLKSITMTNIINEGIQEKMISISSLNMLKNDSLKTAIQNTDQLQVINVGSTKNYNLEIEFVSENKYGSFFNTSISLPNNSSHILIPNWNDLTNSNLKIHLDNNIDGIIDDTLLLTNEFTGIGNKQGSVLPTEFRLEQNYPNPFNPSTKISWQSPVGSWQKLKVYDVLGNEVATLVDEFMPAGSYEVEFNAEGLSSGIYFYQLKVAESVIKTRKMVLLR